MFCRSSNLQDMCLQAIVTNINLFIYNKTIPEKHIVFLFRVYSDEIICKHRRLKNTINEDCMMWFLNPYVKKVTVPENFHSQRILQKLQIIGSRISFLNLHKSKITENELDCLISNVPHVIHLNISETSCTNKTLSCIRKMCPDLEILNVSYCENITNDGIENLCGKNWSLKTLNVLYSGVESYGVIIALNGIPSLECIKYDDLVSLIYEEHNANTCYNLTELLFNNLAGDDNVKVIKALSKMCPKLKRLHFDYPVTTKVLHACTQFQNLEELKIKMSHAYYVDIKVSDVLTPILLISNNLKTLILSCLEISLVILVENFRNLENLYLKNVCFIHFNKVDIKTTETKLDTLVIKDTNMNASNTTYKAIALLISLSRNVTKLHLNHIRNLPEGIFDVILNSMKNLTLVNFNGSSVKMQYLIPFFEIPFMEEVYSNTSIKAFAKKGSCTLSWRQMWDSDDENFDDSNNDDPDNHYYDDDSEESDIISDQCNSTDSETDDKFWRYAYNNDYDLY